MKGPIPNTIDEFAVWAESKCTDTHAIWDDYVKLSGNAESYEYWYEYHEQGFPCMGFMISERKWNAYNSPEENSAPSPMYLTLQDGSGHWYSSTIIILPLFNT